MTLHEKLAAKMDPTIRSLWPMMKGGSEAHFYFALTSDPVFMLFKTSSEAEYSRVTRTLKAEHHEYNPKEIVVGTARWDDRNLVLAPVRYLGSPSAQTVAKSLRALSKYGKTAGMSEFAEAAKLAIYELPMPKVTEPKGDDHRRSAFKTTVLMAGRLNVVGESHSVSRDRQAREERMVRELIATDNYYTEKQFKLPVTSTASGSSGDQQVVEVDADPAHLALRQRFVQEWRTLCTTAIYDALHAESPTCEQIRGAHTNLKAVIDEFLQAIRSGKPSLLAQDLKKEMEIYGDVFQTLNKLWLAVDDQDEMHKGHAGDAVHGRTERKLLAILFQALEKIPERFGKITPLEVNHSRSMAMHNAATQRASHPGVWKVGQSHVADIAALGQQRAYNLVTEEAFEAEYDRWLLTTSDKT